MRSPTTCACSPCFVERWRELTAPIGTRHLRSMRHLLVAALVSVPASSLAAQAGIQLTAGVTSSGVLVTDGVLREKLQPAIAPTIGLVAAIPTGKGPFRALVGVHVSRSQLRATDTDFQTSSDLGALTTIDAVVMAEGPVAGALRWQFGGGAIFYRPSENSGVFVDGPVQRWLIGGGVSWRRLLSPRLRLLVNGRVDNHTFTTPTLLARNYAGTQGVIRLGIHVGVERAF